MNGALSTATIVVSLILAAWYSVRTLMNRPPGRIDLYLQGALGLLVLALVGVAVARLIGGFRPTETATLAGYMFTTVAFPPTAIYLARLEPTRWGSAILTVASLTMPVLVLRLQQIAGA